MTPERESKREAAAKHCAICGKPAVHEHRPFCSRRCADIDLARWLGGGYVIASGGAEADEDGDEGAAKSVVAPRSSEDRSSEDD